MQEVLVNCLGGLSLPKKSVVRLTDHPDMTLDVYRGRKTTTQQQGRQEARDHGQSQRRPNMTDSLCRKQKLSDSFIPCVEGQCELVHFFQEMTSLCHLRDMTLDVYRGRKTTTQQQQQLLHQHKCKNFKST